MLNNTYIHITGIGAATEQRIWGCGIRNWEELLENHSMIKMARNRKRLLLSGIAESVEQLEGGNHVYFAKLLASSHQWRAYRHFRDETAYIDIETTGLSPQFSKITVIGIFDGMETKTYIRGINLQEAPEELSRYKQLVTFNGARFDLPFIEQEFPGFFNHLHTDLMYPLKKLGLSGGLKNIERTLGLSRSEETAGITGLDAVRLWKRYERGDDEALEVLIKYNAEDVENLEKLIEMTYPRMIEREMACMVNR